MTIAIFGSTGKVGRAWMRLAATSSGSQFTDFGGTAAFDLSESAGVESLVARIRADKPDLLVLAAAMTNVDLCERQQQRAVQVNARAAGQIASACASEGTGLLFYSTDHVFDGSGPKAENGTVAPLNAYGLTKVQAEELIRSSGCDYLIVRINVPLAMPVDGDNFYSFVAGNLNAGNKIRIVTDQWNNPLDTDRVAGWSLEAWQQGERGTLHLGGGSYLTRFDIARLIALHLDADANLIESISSAELNQFAPRPARGGLLISRQSELFGTAPDLPTILKSLN